MLEAYHGETGGQTGDVVQAHPGGKQEPKLGGTLYGLSLSYVQGSSAATELEQVGKQNRVLGQLPESIPGEQRNLDSCISYKSCKLTSVSLLGGGSLRRYFLF